MTLEVIRENSVHTCVWSPVSWVVSMRMSAVMTVLISGAAQANPALYGKPEFNKGKTNTSQMRTFLGEFDRALSTCEKTGAKINGIDCFVLMSIKQDIMMDMYLNDLKVMRECDDCQTTIASIHTRMIKMEKLQSTKEKR